MIHKSFKPGKCKTALKLVVSRTKLLKNKKEVLVKQLRRDLAQLLQSGQDQTARVRVEHVIREEKMMAAYELIEIFCELIAIRLPIIESQKNCPIDLKEAVSSVIFATPRCSDIPELIDVRKQVTAKYGKEFVSAAIELRPDCGVNRTLVEKLSAKAPDGPTKLKILTEIAEEHNIKWDPISFGDTDSNPQEDLLQSGPKTLEAARKMHVESSNVHISSENEAKQEAPINYQGNNDMLSFGSQTISPMHANVSVAPAPNLKPPGNGIDGMEPSNSYSEDQNPNFVSQQYWNMEFKDATSAAQAAAESAERASMAARAAAELSIHAKIMNQDSTGFQSSSAYGSRDEGPRKHSGSSIDSEAFARLQMSNSLGERNFRQQDEEISAKGRHNFLGHAERLDGDSNVSNDRPSEIHGATSTSDSSKDKNPLSRPHEQCINDESSQSFGGWNDQNQTSVNEDEEEDVDLATLTERLRGGSHQSEAGFSPSNSRRTSRDTFSDKASFDAHINSFQNLPYSEDDVTIGEFSIRGQSQKFEVEPSDGMPDVLRTEKVSDLEDETFGLHSIGASYSRSSFSRSVSDGRANVESNSRNLEDAAIWNPFANVDEEKYHEDVKIKKEGHSVVFDDYGSDGEVSVFDLDKGPEASSHTFSPERKLMSYLSENINPAGLRRNRVDLFGNNISESHSSKERSSASIFSESLDESAAQVLKDELAPVIFDDVSGAYSENKEEPKNSERDPEGIFTSGSERSRFNLSGKGSGEFDDPVNKKNQDQGSYSRVSSVHEADDDDSKTPQRSSYVDDSETSGKSSSDGATELSFGKLTGGLRNKGYRHPPYVKSLLGEGPSSVQAAEGEVKRSSISNPQETWSSSEIVDDPYSQELNDEIQKRTSTAGTYERHSLDEASSAGKLSEDTATSPGKHKETIDSEIGDPNTCDKDVEYNRLSGRVEEESMRSLSGEAPLSKQAVGDPSNEYGFSSPSGQISGSHLELTREMDSSQGKRSNFRDFLSPCDTEQSRDLKEEVLSQVSASRGRYGAGLSRRTRGSPSKADRSSLLKSSLASEEDTQEPLKYSSRGPYKDRRSEVKSAYLSKEGEAPERRAEIKSSSKNSYGIGAYRSAPSESAALDDKGSSDRLQLAKEGVVNPKSKPQKFSERPPMSSEISDIGAYRSAASESAALDDKGSSDRLQLAKEGMVKPKSKPQKFSERPPMPSQISDIGAYRSALSDSAALDDKGSSDRLQLAKEGVVKPKSRPQKFSERPPMSSQISDSSGSSEKSKPPKQSLEDTSRESSFNRGSHVHPKLPDYDSIAAQLELLRVNRK